VPENQGPSTVFRKGRGVRPGGMWPASPSRRGRFVVWLLPLHNRGLVTLLHRPSSRFRCRSSRSSW
jgi:hypothetical protein